MFTHVSQGTSVVVARRDDSSDVVVNIKKDFYGEKAGNDAIGLF